jgi:enoyl-CoA hydratase
MSSEPILYESQGRVARIWHNRPEARNAESREMLVAMMEALDRAEQDPEIRVVILGGKGDHFSAGHDLKQAAAERGSFTPEQRFAFEMKHYYDYSMRLYNFPKPTIAQVQGACISAGFMIANLCDLIVASDDAFFSDPVVHSLGAASVEVLVHPWVLGARRAKEMLFTGDRLTAAKAYEWGMINRVVPRAELENETQALAERIAQAPSFAVQLTKRSINRSLEAMGMMVALQSHFDVHQLSHVSEEYQTIVRTGGKSMVQRGRHD